MLVVDTIKTCKLNNFVDINLRKRYEGYTMRKKCIGEAVGVK